VCAWYLRFEPIIPLILHRKSFYRLVSALLTMVPHTLRPHLFHTSS
jgi:hypothetical protein